MLHNVQVVTTVSMLWVSSGIASAEPLINSGQGVSDPVFRRSIESSLGEGSRPMEIFHIARVKRTDFKHATIGGWNDTAAIGREIAPAHRQIDEYWNDFVLIK